VSYFFAFGNKQKVNDVRHAPVEINRKGAETQMKMQCALMTYISLRLSIFAVNNSRHLFSNPSKRGATATSK